MPCNHALDTDNLCVYRCDTFLKELTMIICDNCEEAKAVKYNDGDRVCQACSDIIDDLRKTNPELWQAGECIRCGADKCEDAMCKEEVLREQEAQDGEDDRTTFDMSDDADALASAGWGTDEDYGCYGDE